MVAELPDDAPLRLAAALQRWWLRSAPHVLAVGIAVLGVVAVLKLATEFHRLTMHTGFTGGIDVRLRWHEVQSWFSGVPFYEHVRRISYPPQAYALLWPFLGWLDLQQARWLWAVTTVLVLGGLTWLLVRASTAESRRERMLVAAAVFSMNAVGVSVGNGQVTLHLLLALLTGLALLEAPRVSLLRDAGAACLLAASLAKPTMTAPFAWAVILRARRVRPLVLTAVAYVIATLLAAAYQPHGPIDLLRQWVALNSTRFGRGYGNVATALVDIGHGELAPAAGIALVLALGIWILRHHKADSWILLGVSALIARFWTYHLVYDDALILIPMVALFRIAKRTTASVTDQVTAGVLFALAALAMLAPARMETASPPLNWVFIGGHVLVWLIMLWYLMSAAKRFAAE